MRKKITWTALAVILSLGCSQAQPSNRNMSANNAPITKTGVQTVYTVDQLVGNSAGKMVASTNYQVSIIFPTKVQSVGVNASKQNAVMATIDEYDGRVVYIDVLKAGGTATLNLRLLSAGDEYEEKNGVKPTSSALGAKSNLNRDPVILKVLVDLTDKASGVLSYTIKNKSARTPQASAPAPARVATVAAPRAPTPAPVVKSKPIAAAPLRPKPIPAAPLLPKPIPAAPLRPTSVTGTNSGVTLTVSRTETARNPQNQALSYKVELTQPVAGKTYTLDTAATTLRIRNAPIADLFISKGNYPLNVSAPVTGMLEIPKRVEENTGPKVLMFVVVENDITTQIKKRKYVGVILK